MASHTVKRRKLSPSPENDQESKSLGNGDTKTNGTEKKSHADNAGSKPPMAGGMAGRGKVDRSAELASATGLYKSSFFKLQMDELLSELRPHYDTQVARIQDTLYKLKGVIEDFPEKPPRTAVEAEKELRTAHKVAVPFPEPRPEKDAKYPMSYAKPININVVGSFGLRTGSRSTDPYSIDLAVTMPGSIFQEKDYANYRYFHKRAYYVACIAAAVRQAKDLKLRPKFEMQDGVNLRPILVLELDDVAKGDSARSKIQIRIITAIEDSVFPAQRTLPAKCNVRHAYPTGEEEGATPYYNSALRSEATVALYHKCLYSAAQKCASFRDACILGRTWLYQRGLRSSYHGGGFGGFEWTVLMALLFEGGGPNGKPILSSSYSSYQLFKATLQFIAGRDLMQPLQLFTTGNSFPKGGPVLFDGKRGINVLYKMTRWSYALLRHETTITLNMLNESRHDNFERVFIVKVNEPMLRFDRILSLPSAYSKDVLQSILHEYTVYDVLSRALGNRVKLISLSGQDADPWTVDAKPSSKKAGKKISVGLLLDSDNAARVVDHGPSAEEREEASSFRSFWGEKSELRRFKDGSILESLVWSDLPSAPSILHQILVYILDKFFGYEEGDIEYVGDAYDEKLRNAGDGIVSYSTPAFQTITNAFRSLEGTVQNMDEVPLVVRQLSPTSPLLRYTALRIQDPVTSSSKPVDLVLQFESSARWPDDLAAVQMTKVAFLVKIGDYMESSGAATSCRVGLENESSKILNVAFLDIHHESGVIFRLRIHHDREQTLLERQLKEKTISAGTKEETAYTLSAYKRNFIQAPRLTQVIRTLCTRFPLLSPTIRLVKHWFNTHLFTGQIHEEVIELLTARAFTQPNPWQPPSSIMTGFLRTIHFLSRWDWQQEPLIVDVGGELDQERIETIRTRFAAWRSIDPAMNSVALFVASDIDPDGVTWTQYEMPPKVVAARVTTLAKAAVKLLREKTFTMDVNELFHTSLAPYDFVINLRSKLVTDHRSSMSTIFKNLNDQAKGRVSSKFDMVRSFVQDLRACYGPVMLLFHGDEHCNVIAGLWNPQSLKPKSFGLKLPYSTSPTSLTNSKRKTEGEDNVTINRSAILNEISRLGDGMVESIEVHNK